MLLDTHNTLISYSHSHLFECKLNTQLFTLCFNDYDYRFLYILQTFCNAFPVQCQDNCHLHTYLLINIRHQVTKKASTRSRHLWHRQRSNPANSSESVLLTWNCEWQNTELPSASHDNCQSFADHRPMTADMNTLCIINTAIHIIIIIVIMLHMLANWKLLIKLNTKYNWFQLHNIFRKLVNVCLSFTCIYFSTSSPDKALLWASWKPSSNY